MPYGGVSDFSASYRGVNMGYGAINEIGHTISYDVLSDPRNRESFLANPRNIKCAEGRSAMGWIIWDNVKPSLSLGTAILSFAGWYGLIPDRVGAIALIGNPSPMDPSEYLRRGDVIIYDASSSLSDDAIKVAGAEHLHLEAKTSASLVEEITFTMANGRRRLRSTTRRWWLETDCLQMPPERTEHALCILDTVLINNIHYFIDFSPSFADDARKFVDAVSFGHLAIPDDILDRCLEMSDCGYVLGNPAYVPFLRAALANQENVDPDIKRSLDDLLSIYDKMDELVRIWAKMAFDGDEEWVRRFLTNSKRYASSITSSGLDAGIDLAIKAHYDHDVPIDDLFGSSSMIAKGGEYAG